MTPANQMQCVKLDDPLDAALRMIRHRTYRHVRTGASAASALLE